jgi:hypothetical protein
MVRYGMVWFAAGRVFQGLKPARTIDGIGACRVGSRLAVIGIFQKRYGARVVQIVELLVIDRPEEHGHCNQQAEQGQRNQDQQDIHACMASGELALARPTRNAFSTTASELSDIPMEASHAPVG